MKKFFVILGLALTFSACVADEEGGNVPGGKVKNIIVLISDGCGYYHVDAASLYQYGETGTQVYERFPYKIAMATYNISGEYDPDAAWAEFDYVKHGSTDSAAAATAMSTGEKTYRGAIGVDLNGVPVKNIIEYAEEKKMATGVVTSVQFSHATPAAFVAHNVSRYNYAAIANEMIYDSALEVIMGCGAPDFDKSGVPASGEKKYVGGDATWTDLTDDGEVIGSDADSDGFADAWKVIRSREAFQNMANGDTPQRVIGIPYVYHTLQYERDGDYNADPYEVQLTETVPTLEEMTKAAINVLDNDEDGFFLMVEGGAVDWAGHGNSFGRLMEEQIDFNRSVEAVVDWVNENSNWDETLVIVTGDHETGYLTGPDSNPTWKELVNNGPGNLPGMEWHSNNHTNSLIPFYANGSATRFFNFVVVDIDPVRGDYIDNTSLGNIIIDILKGQL